MSDTIHKQTVLSMLERDIENKYAYIKQQTIRLLTNLSSSFPLLKVALLSTDKWLSGKEKQYLPIVQNMVNMSVDSCFTNPEITIDDGYANAKYLINNSIDELIKSKSSLNLESVDQILQILIGTKLSL